MYKFERLEVWRLALEYDDVMFRIAAALPLEERFDLAAQIRSASRSIAANIAEGSTTQTAKEQARFLGLAIPSFIETVACLRLVERRRYPLSDEDRAEAEQRGAKLFAKLQAFRRAVLKTGTTR
ncbi:MAG: four helix bundle protein [Gemmatimonadota bacterium]